MWPQRELPQLRRDPDCAPTLSDVGTATAKLFEKPAFMASSIQQWRERFDAPVGWCLDGRNSIDVGRQAIARNGYSGRTLAGAIPNIFLNVREKCAESAKPAACAASVSDSPPT